MIARSVTLALLGSLAVHASSSPKERRDRHAQLAKKQEDGFNGYMSVGYYANWVLYQDFSVTSIPVDRYTHLLYSFANMTAEGTVFLSDPWADTQYLYPGDSTAEGDLGGSLKQFYLIKKAHRNLKTMISVGGWTYRHAFASLPDAAWRAEFVRSSVKLVVDLGLDGIDIDYEWADAKTKEGTAELMVELRRGLDEAAAQIGAEKLLLSYAAPCGSAWDFLDIPKMDANIDFWNLMAYEYAGGFAKMTKPTANLLPDDHPDTSTYSGKRCIDFFLNGGATARKLNLGMPMYGTGWNGTDGMYSEWTSRGTGSEMTPGFYHARDLPVEGESIVYNETLGAAWSFSPADGHLVSFDIPRVALQKTQYVIDNGLGGLMWWAIDEDWVEPAAQQAKRHLERKKRTKNGKRSCSRPSAPGPGMGNVHAVEPGSANSTSSSVSGSASAISASSASASSSSAAASSSSSSSAAPRPDPSSTSETEGEQDGIQLNIGRSLAQVAKEGFERYAQGLDTTWNVLSYPSSEYGNVRSGM